MRDENILELCESLADHVDSERVLSINEMREPFWNGEVGVDVDNWNQWYSPIEPLYHDLDHMIRTTSPLQCERVLNNERFLAIENDLHRLRAAYENDKELVQARNILQNRARAGQSQIDNLLIQESYWAIPTELRAVLFHKQHILVVGSGPLPITGLSIARTMGTRVTCLEHDPKAFFIGEQVIHLAGHSIDSINYDIMDLDNLDQYDAIVGVVLFGISDRSNYKTEAIQHILTNVRRRDTTVALRAPHGLGQLLYPPVDLKEAEGFRINRVVPDVGINNSYRSAIITAQKL